MDNNNTSYKKNPNQRKAMKRDSPYLWNTTWLIF